MPHINEMYANCQTPEDFEETRKRFNLWLCCELAPEVAMEYMRREREGRE